MKLVALILFLLSSTSAWAEWTRAARTDTAILYIDRATIHQQGDLVQMWTLSDYQTFQQVGGNRFLSAKYQYELDCDGGRFRLLYFAWYTEHMGGGEAVAMQEGSKKWQPVGSDTEAEIFWRIACKR